MIPSNVMSFMKKMVTNETVSSTEPADSGNTLSKLRQTLSSSLMNAQDKVTKLTPVRQTIQPEPIVTPPEEKPEEPAPFPPKPQPKDPGRRAGTCRVCLKSFKPEEFFKMCSECQQKVCEDCASYSKLDENQDESTWSCSICRRKRQSRTQPIITQESTDSLLDVPVLEALQRRHSDVKIGGGSASGSAGGLGSGLAPPRSPELRRHSDVSPASLKEIEKVAGDRRDELRWERELEWRKKGASPGASRAQSPHSERRPFQEESRYSQQQLPGEGAGKDEEDSSLTQKGTRGRRKSRIGRQRSYDDEIKSAGSSQFPAAEPGLGLPVSLPRRASAYDVYAFRQGEAALGSSSMGSQSTGPAVPPTGRRASFRIALKQEEPPSYEVSVPASPEGTVPGVIADDDRRSRRRGSQLPDISNMRGLHQVAQAKAPPRTNPETLINNEPIRRQPSCDGEAIKIVIDDVDSDTAFAPRPGSRKRVVLRKDPTDKAHRTRGFGMRVVGGKASIDGRLFAYIVWTVPGGPAEKAGLQQGDKILEWCGVSLIDRSFEEVCSVMDRTGDIAELLVEHANDLRMCDLLDDPGGLSLSQTPRKSSNAESLGLALDLDSEKTPSSPTRRKLPKTPEQICREKQVTGRVQIQVFYNDERKELSVAVLAADDLACHEDTGYGTQPEAYAQLRLLPTLSEQHCVKTDVAEATQNPMWNATLEFPNVPGEDLMDRTIEVTLWDYCPDKDPLFLGECTVELQKAFLDDRPVWYRLEDPRQIRLGDKSPYVSPRGSLANEIAMRLLRRSDFALSRSFSDDRESEGSQEFNFLHPDHAWATCGSRRGSSQSEGHLEPEAVYQLGQDYSRSLPGSRRSSFHKEGDARDEGPPPQLYVNKGRRRSSVVRHDPEEILRSLKACKGDMFGRQMSLTHAEKRSSAVHRRHSLQYDSSDNNLWQSKHSNFDESGKGFILCMDVSGRLEQQFSKDLQRGRYFLRLRDFREMKNRHMFQTGSSCQPTTRKDSVVPLPEPTICSSSSPEDEDDKWSNSAPIKLGPGQIRPKGRRGMQSRGEVKLGLLMTKGQLELEVVSARNIMGSSKDSPPDTYIKTYLKDNDRSLQKRKTKVVPHSNDPVFRQTLKYSACDVFGRTLMVMLWERQKGFEHNQGLGGAELALDKLQLTHLTLGWYPLFPIQRLGSDSNGSP